MYVARAPTRVLVCGGQETADKGNGDYGARDGGDDDRGSLIADGWRGGFGRWTTIADIHLATGGIDWAVGRVHIEFSPSISVNKPRYILIPEGNVTYTHSIWTLLYSDSCSSRG